jgi:adenine-specific DNA methylase
MAACSIRPAATAPFQPHSRLRGDRNGPAHCPPGALNIDFFAYPESEKFATVIGNPPYVKARDILPQTACAWRSSLLDGHANLYLHFIEKCVRHLAPGGELILITPRDFLKATGAGRLNTWLYDQGTITDFEDLGDAKDIRRRRTQLRHLALREGQCQPSPARRPAHGAGPADS